MFRAKLTPSDHWWPRDSSAPKDLTARRGRQGGEQSRRHKFPPEKGKMKTFFLGGEENKTKLFWLKNKKNPSISSIILYIFFVVKMIGTGAGSSELGPSRRKPNGSRSRNRLIIKEYTTNRIERQCFGQLRQLFRVPSPWLALLPRHFLCQSTVIDHF